MARTFTNDGSANDTIKVTAQGFTAWGFGSLFVCVRPVGVSATRARSLVLIGTDAQDFAEFYFLQTSTPHLGWYNGAANEQTSGTFSLINKWCIVGMTKDTGTVAARFHIFDFAAATWTHGTFGGALANPSGTGATQHGTYGDGSGNELDAFDGQMLAWGAWKSRVFTDSECERLSRGLWDLWNPDLLMEFPPGRDNLTRTTIDCSRNRMRQAVSGSQITRADIVGPPGFRLSALNRRR